MATESARAEVAVQTRRARAAAPSGTSWPRLVAEFCRKRTLGAMGGAVILLMILVANLIVDVVYAFLDPRVRYS